MSSSSISEKIEDGVMTLTLNSGPLNTLDIDIMAELARKYAQIKEFGETRLVILRSGVEGVFSHGIDPHFFLNQDMKGRERVFVTLGEMVYSMQMCGVPTISLVNGPALAGGAVLGLLHDFVFVHQKTGVICFSEPKVNLPIPRFLQTLIKQKLSGDAAIKAWLMGKNFNAEELLSHGAISGSFTSSEQRDDLVGQLVKRIKRLNGKVLRHSLMEDRRGLSEDFIDFKDRFELFAEFLTDDYLGAALKEIVAKS